MLTLFGTQSDLPSVEAAPTLSAGPEGPFASVVLEQSIDRALSYAIPRGLVSQLQVGQRVRVPLGKKNRPTFGYVVSIDAAAAHPKIKKLYDIADERVLVPGRLLDLTRWMSRYYCCALGAVIDSIVPSAVKKRIGIGYMHVVRLTATREEAQAQVEKMKAPKRRAVLARLLQLEPDSTIELVRLASEAGATTATVRKLVRLGFISITQHADLPSLTHDMPAGAADEPPIALNADQQRVYQAMHGRLGSGFSVNLLLGVTGSGKTEIYLRCIADAVAAGKQAIVLVPEIALTPQTVRRFTARFKQVAILHSGLSASQRHRYWQQIALGRAQVVVGARSAIFAPAANLGIVVVDEEHDASYKQDSAPRYHGRDVAIKRAQLEGVPVVLGSATPSLESYWRVCGPPAMQTASEFEATVSTPVPLVQLAEQVEQRGSNYHLLPLPSRVRALAMPQVELIDMKVENRARRGVHLLSQRLENLLRQTVAAGQQAILLLNRRGYSNFVHCPSCSHLVQCKYCDTTMTYHRTTGEHPASASVAKGIHTGQLHCHYCLAVNPLPERCPECGKLLSLFGLGTQRVEEEIAKKFPDLVFARVDSDTMRNAKDYEELLGKFARREIQVMVGTQMIAKGLDYPNVTLVGVINGDTALALPDFRAAERTFQLITQVAGRAGRGDVPGRVVLQTFLPDDPTIQAAIRQDYMGFARAELASRREVGLPPFARMVRIILRDQDQQKLHKQSEDLAAHVAQAIAEQGPQAAIKAKGPMPCAISRIAGYFRNQIVLLCPTAPPLQKLLADIRAKAHLTRNERVAVDVDPVSLL